MKLSERHLQISAQQSKRVKTVPQSEERGLMRFIINVRLDFHNTVAYLTTPLSDAGILTFVSFLFYSQKNKANFMATINHFTKTWKESKMQKQ